MEIGDFPVSQEIGLISCSCETCSSGDAEMMPVISSASPSVRVWSP